MPYYISDDFGISLKVSGEDGGKENYVFFPGEGGKYG